MTIATDDLGVLGNLAVALGVFTPGGSPNPNWFGDPEASLRNVLANSDQRDALIAFVDEAMGGADRTTDLRGVVWLPIVHLDDPDLTIAVTVDDAQPDGVHIGLGLSMRTASPGSVTSLAVPLFRVGKEEGPTVTEPFLLGSPGGRIRIATSITIDDTAPVPGVARLGAIGLDVDLPTSAADSVAAVFGLSLAGFQLPGASSPRDIRVAADGLETLDDALLDLVLSLVKAQADSAAANSPIAAVAGLLGLTGGDAIPDFPINDLPTQGVGAITEWLHGVMTTAASRDDWLGYLAVLLGGVPGDGAVSFTLGGGAALKLGLQVDSGPTGNARLTPTLEVELGGDDARVEARADLFRIDLVTGAAVALPRLGVWAAAGRPVAGKRVLDISSPTAVRADTLRVGFGLDAERRLTFVLAADGVELGAHAYPTLDLTSTDAVMDAANTTVSDVAVELLGNLGTALPAVRLLIGLDAPAGVTAVTLPALMSDPVAAVAAYWRDLVAAPGGAATTVLATLREALADASEAASAILGTGTPLDPWRVPLIGPLALEFAADGPVLTLGIAVATSVDTLGQRCTVIETRLAATLAKVDLAAKTASLLPGVEAALSARERGINPPRVTLALGQDTTLTAGGVGLRLGWTPDGGLEAGIEAPKLQLTVGTLEVPIALPVVAADGSVSLPAAGWDGVEVLVGYLGELLGGLLGDVVAALGWTTEVPVAGGRLGSFARLRLADLVDEPEAALGAWLPQLAMSDTGTQVLGLIADLLAGSGDNRGLLEGSGHPDDPYRLALADGLPNVAVWFPPAGLEPILVAAPETLRSWRPRDPGLPPAALAACLLAEAGVADDVRALVDGRDLAAGLEAIAQRWAGGDGRIVPPTAAPPGVAIRRAGLAAGQLFGHLDLRDLTGRIPTTTVYVALGAEAWPDAPAGRRVDLSTPGLDAAMFAVPAAVPGDWFVALGRRSDCLASGATGDGTAEQAARLARLLDALADVSSDIAVVALAGAGHAARVAVELQDAVTDLVTLGTPLAPIALTALSTQPTADAIRLLHRLLPPAPDAADPEAEDEDLALGRALVGAMMELAERVDPAAELRPPTVTPAPPRAGLAVTAVFGAVSESQVSRAITAIVAAGLALRARVRAAAAPLPLPGGVVAGLHYVLAPTTTGSVSVSGSALLTLFSFDATAGIASGRQLRVQLRIADRLGWLSATADLELRMLTADLRLPLDGVSPGEARVTLHDARVGSQSWERLLLGNVAGAVPVLPEARILLAAAIQRVTADLAGTASLELGRLLGALGIIAPTGGVAGDAVDQLVHDPAGLLRQRLAAAGDDVADAVAALLGPLAAGVDLDAGTVRVRGGDDSHGRFGWDIDVTASATALAGHLRLGAAAPAQPAGGLNLDLDLDPLQIALQWHQPGGATDTVVLWPNPDPAPIARTLARAAPSLGGHAALELMRRADAAARPVIDAALDAFGLLSGAAGDAERAIRPLAGLLADPAGWLRSAGSLGVSPARIQALFDALRPLLGVGGGSGTPLALANGVTLAVTGAGSGARLSLTVDPTLWTAPGGGGPRLAAGLGASLTVEPAGAPSLGFEAYVGLSGGSPGRQAVYARLGAGGIELFLRPANGADIPLVPFAGLGSLVAAAEAALPFLLDKLAAAPGSAGELVQTVGDALALRLDTPKRFDAAALHAWGANPVNALSSALPSILATGLGTLAPRLDAFVPAGVDVTADLNSLTVTIGKLSLSWDPAAAAVELEGAGIDVPGIDRLSFTVALSATGLEEVSVTVGPAEIDAGGVMLRPFATVAAGLSPAGGRRVAIGMAVDDTHRFAVRWLLDSQQFDFIASDQLIADAVDTTDPTQVALRVVEVVADLVAGVAIAQQAVQDLLDLGVGDAGKDVRDLLAGVVLNASVPTQLIENLFDPTTLRERVATLFGNIGEADIAITIGGFEVGFDKPGNIVGLRVGLADRFELLSGDVTLWLENDGSWIVPKPSGAGGLFVGLLDKTSLQFAPSLAVNGLGLRIGKASGPLLDFGITLESIALHTYAELGAGGVSSGGIQLQFSNLAVSAAGATGDNGIAQGIMRDTGPTPPRPAFSPALAIQKHGSDPVAVTLRAGEGDGPWWVAIQKGFGPLYLEQIGFGATMPQGRVERVSLLMDGSVSMFGLTCAVDDLQITYIVRSDGQVNDIFSANAWVVDLAGLAVSAEMAGVSIAGGLLKQTTEVGIEYLGMLLGRFGVYGITIYGGYGEGQQGDQKFTAFFAVGAVNGPIGGPPAFFLTGIGGGFGINRQLVVPSDLSRFGDYPLIQALDIAAQPQDPMQQLRKLGEYFPMAPGTFWFAAGLSFNSFALVDGIAVVAVEIGDGLDISLLGLARMALPRPQVALVSIEVALLVRFSSAEGVLWVQGQLTDNSWLLYPDIKLTGGFAYVIWFKGEHRGEFVLTLGGYHPDFHRDGYPVVPRLGLRWSIGGSIVIKAGSYFALTSEALMAGGDFEASADFGPAWAEVKFGAHGIVYFDPFHYQVNAYARIAAGVTIDTWLFGEITISVSLGARIDVSGPEFHGRVTFEVGPIELTVSFGGSDQAQKQPISADAFIAKYLEVADGGAARAHALMTGRGAQPSKGEEATPDGSSARPFVVVVEFDLTFTSTVPATRITRTLALAEAATSHAPSTALGVAPMDAANVEPAITLTWQRGGVAQTFPFAATARPYGSFPAGIWGLPQDPNNRKVPKAEMIEALNEIDLVTRADPSAPGPEIPYYQVEIGKRKPLPFTRSGADIAKLKTQAQAVSDLVTEPATVAAAFAQAKTFLAKAATPTALASLRGERQAPPLLGTLTEGLETPTHTVIPDIGEAAPAKVYDHFIDPPVAVGLASGATVDLRVGSKARTTVKDSTRAWRIAPPTLAAVEAQRSKSIAVRLVVSDPVAASTGRRGTVIGAVAVPPTAAAHAAPMMVARSGAAGAEALASFSAALSGGRSARGSAGATLTPGQIVVLKLPNARADAALDAERPRLAVAGAAARVVVLGHGGRVLADRVVAANAADRVSEASLEIVRGAERIVAIGQGEVGAPGAEAGLAGWHAGMQMPYAGWSTAVAPGCVVRSVGERLALHRERLDAGWVSGAELARGLSTVTTTFAQAPKTVVIVLDDPAAFGDAVSARRLLLGLDGAERARDAAGQERAPVLLVTENRSVLAYDIVPARDRPVVVTIASDLGWSLVGVMASTQLDATGAIGLISARGLDAAVRPFAKASAAANGTSRLEWLGPTRTQKQRQHARLLASGQFRPTTRRTASPKLKKGGRR